MDRPSTRSCPACDGDYPSYYFGSYVVTGRGPEGRRVRRRRVVCYECLLARILGGVRDEEAPAAIAPARGGVQGLREYRCYADSAEAAVRVLAPNEFSAAARGAVLLQVARENVVARYVMSRPKPQPRAAVSNRTGSRAVAASRG
jgi:hypothetical protein